MHKLLESLTSAYAVSGDEKQLHDIIRGAAAGLVTEIHETPLGNLLAVRRGQSSDHSILFAAHLDEVGAWVTRINEKGFLGIHCRSVDPRVWPGQQVVVHGTRPLPGIIGLKPVHVMAREELERPLPMEELWVDVGLPREAVEACVPIGSTVTFTAGVKTLLGDRFAGKTMDDRLCAVALVQALELLQGRTLPYDMVMAFTVQEEVTGNGAWTTGYTARPDVGSVMRVRTFSSVDLPAPFLPMTPTISPCSTVNDTSLSAQNSWLPSCSASTRRASVAEWPICPMCRRGSRPRTLCHQCSTSSPSVWCPMLPRW